MVFRKIVQSRHAEWVWHIDDMPPVGISPYSILIEEDSVSSLCNCIEEELKVLQDSDKKIQQLRFCLIVQKGVELLMDELNELTEYFERQDNDSMEVTFGYAVNAVQEKKLCLALLIDVYDGKKVD